MTPSPHDITCYAPQASAQSYQLKAITGAYGVVEIDMQDGGNYVTAPTITVTASPGTGFQAHAIMRYQGSNPANYVSHVFIDNPGTGYPVTSDGSGWAVTFTGGGGTRVATATAYGGTYASQNQFPMRVVDYSFTRKTTWGTQVRRYKDQSTIELYPFQEVAMFEFTLKSERWTWQDAQALESMVDSVKGAGYAMWMTAPDDGCIYNVRFKEDPQGYSVPSSVIATGELTLVTVGDVDNTIDNSLAYPPAPGTRSPNAPVTFRRRRLRRL
jgi:hypothetical protein